MHPIISQLNRMVENAKLSGIGEEIIRVMIKETLQDYVLQAIYASDHKHLIFIGGTALRKLYQLPRMSEDLDFTSLVQVDLPNLRHTIHHHFSQIRFEPVTSSIQQSDNVHRLIVKFAVLHDIGLSPLKDENVHVKVELTVDPTKFPTKITMYNGSNLFIPMRHYPLETMMAGKIAACLNRVWEKGDTGIRVKGRDYYDLIWYMEKGIRPTSEKLIDFNPDYTKEAVFPLLDEKVKLIKSSDLLADLKPYLTDISATTMWCKKFHELYRKYRINYP